MSTLPHKIAHEQIVKEKLDDTQMRENLSVAMHTLQRNRLNVINTKFSNWQGLRDKAKQAKNNALMSLEERLLEFEANAIKNGIKVHWASSSEDACEIIYNLMLEKNIKKILKGKSMASEEIGLNHYLESKGISAIETDLGELILQLKGESPVHIVVPAIHRNRYEIGKIFEEKLNAPLESEIEKLNAIARKHLRDEFEGLEMGLSGVNFAMSKEGAFWLIENEGNGRMCTTAPSIHVAICGIEKVMETFEDAATMVHLLTPSATGQFIPTYNNIITGPRGKNGELDGPQEVHIVLFDHHRSDMLSHKDYYEALRCIRCGACMNFCPVYDKIGGHTYQTTYPGPIGEVISPNLFGMDETGDILSFCSLCGRCSEVCPVKIPLADLIRKLRANKAGQESSRGATMPLGVNASKKNAAEASAMSGYAKVATNGALWRFSLSKGHYFSAMLQKFKDSIPVVKKWSAFKELPEIKLDLYKELQKLDGVIYE
ncbi:MAG: LutB/LldF family L-lactate oxidation iron-sulfur protein [Helicobacteraceae bacterium]|nr:LutB/LldF family L-lactate oxidation iron-sulfur protein [Helicobacteraceae bacterium]